MTAIPTIRLTPDRLAEIDLRRIAQGARGGAERTAEHRAGQRHADCGTGQRTDAGAHNAAGQSAVARTRSAARNQKPARDYQDGHKTHEFAPQWRKAGEYRSRILRNTILSIESMACMSRLKSYKSKIELYQAFTWISDSHRTVTRIAFAPETTNRGPGENRIRPQGCNRRHHPHDGEFR